MGGTGFDNRKVTVCNYHMRSVRWATERHIENAFSQFPALLRHAFPKANYVLLEVPDVISQVAAAGFDRLDGPLTQGAGPRPASNRGADSRSVT